MKQPRKNRQMSITVAQAIYMQGGAMTSKAAVHLAAHGVPFDVAHRVLTTPHRRDMGDISPVPRSWHDIILTAGPTYGDQVVLR